MNFALNSLSQTDDCTPAPWDDQLDTQLDIQAWMQKSQPLGPCCEWPRWQGGDPADRWPAASDWPLNR